MSDTHDMRDTERYAAVFKSVLRELRDTTKLIRETILEYPDPQKTPLPQPTEGQGGFFYSTGDEGVFFYIYTYKRPWKCVMLTIPAIRVNGGAGWLAKYGLPERFTAADMVMETRSEKWQFEIDDLVNWMNRRDFSNAASPTKSPVKAKVYEKMKMIDTLRMEVDTLRSEVNTTN